MTTATTPTLVRDRYAAAAEPLTHAVLAVPADRWDRPSPCEGWTARDVLDHIISAQRDFLQGRGLLPATDEPTEESDAPDPAGRWTAHRNLLRELLTCSETAATAYEGFFGPTTVGDSLLTFYIPDMIVHRWDLASAVGGDTRLTDSEMDGLDAAIESWGDALYSEGVFRPGVTAPPGADRQTVLLARMGRRAGGKAGRAAPDGSDAIAAPAVRPARAVRAPSVRG